MLNKVILVAVFLLFFLNVHAALSSTFLDCVEFGNTPIDKVMPLSDGKYVSLMGMPSRVFSLMGNEIVFEQSVPSSESYARVQKGDGDILFAASQIGTLDIYSYDRMDGLHLLSSTDLSDPAGDITLAHHLTCFALANGTLIFESQVSSFDGEEWICRNIVDVNDPLSPLLISRTYIDYEERYTGFYYLDGHYIYIGYNGALYVSDTPTAYPDSVDIPGLQQLSIHYTAQIEDSIYIICSNSLQEFRFAGLEISDINAPTLSLLHSTQLRQNFDMVMDSDHRICVTGINSADIWQIDKYLYSNQDDWQLLDTANFGDLPYKLFPISGGYFAAGIYDSMILDSQLNIQATLNESSNYFLYELILGRYLILGEYTWYERIGYRIFDLQTEEFLDFFNDEYLERSNTVYGTNKIIFMFENVVVVEFDEGGISQTWNMPTPNGISQASVRGDLLALSGYVNGQWRIYIYTLTASGIVLQSERVIPHVSANLCFYDENHLFVNRLTMGEDYFMYFYRIEQDYSLTYLNEFVLSGSTGALIMDEAIINTYNGGRVIDTTDPDNPILSQTISIPTYAGYSGSYDGHGHYMFKDFSHSFILDSDYQLTGYLPGNKLCFYQSGCFLKPGPTSVVKAQIDAIVSNDDNLYEYISAESIRNYPNPFNPETTIEFKVPTDGEVVLTIYNVKGQKVKELLNKQMLAGKLAVSWDGTDAEGRSVVSGLYFAQIMQGDTRQVHKMLLMK